MRSRLVKVLRQNLRMRGISICAEPYTKLESGQVIASEGRRIYKKMKKEI